jgi:thiamine biosynthesis lipoprotein
MALTLNGIAQGYITDRVADLLRSYGFDHVLINMGETRALGSKLDGVPWNIKINNTNEVLPLADQAIATSGGYGTPFGATGQHHHLFSPGTGRSTSLWTSMSVIAPTATMADGLSTGLSALTEQDISRISTEHNVSVYAYNADYKWSSQPDS